MKAIQYARFGGPEVLEPVEMPEPHPGPGQVRVAVRAVGVNPIDWKMRSGMMGGELPRALGARLRAWSTSSARESRTWRLGIVYSGLSAALAPPSSPCWATTPGSPASLDFAGAAALPVAVETAARTLELLGVREDTTLLVNGAAGAVGSSAVQLARLRGARVIGTASPHNHEYLRSLGAEPTTYGVGLADRVRAIAPGGVDAALDAAGGGALTELVELAGGPERVVTIADYAGAQQTGAQFSGGMGTERALHALADIGPLIESGTFALPVAQTFPLERIGEAHALSQDGHVRGKLVLLVD